LDSRIAPRAEPLPAARLLIHAASKIGSAGFHFKSALKRLRARYSVDTQSASSTALRIQVDDLQGVRQCAIDDAGALTEVPLPAGTYHVSVSLGSLHRSYTMTLEPNACVDLYVQLAQDLP
jgi:hypothetical protein